MKRILLLFLFLNCCTITYAQETITVNGVVKDGTNQPLPGATITEKGTSNRVISNTNGNYQIKVKSNGVLVYTYLGYKVLERPVKGLRTIDVKLLDEDNNLNEVVVVGYGQTVQRKDLTGAVSSIKGEELAKVPVQNVGQALQGRLAGVQVSMADGSPGAPPSIVIRGGTSITQSNEPLYVVDGVPQTDGLAFLDPMDIESIDVLKDVSATSIYGARGANGVVLVTTKQTKEGKVSINYDGYFGVKKVTKFLDMMSPLEYTKLRYERAIGDPTRFAAFLKTYGSFDSLQIRYGDRPGVNWQKEAFGDAVINQSHKLSINGGGKETRFNMFYSRNNDNGILLNSASEKNIAKLTLNHNVSKKFIVNGIVNYANQKITGLGTGEGRLSLLNTIFQYRPVSGIAPDDFSLVDLDIDPLDPNPASVNYQSPVVTLNTQHREMRLKSLNMNASGQYTIDKHFTYRGLVNFTDNNNSAKSFNDSRSLVSLRSGGATGAVGYSNSQQFNYNNTLTYANVFNTVHKLDVSIGQEYIYNYAESLNTSSSNFPSLNLGWNKLQLGTVTAFPTTFAEDSKLLSFFSRANYAYKGKYLLTATVRADGSSKFGQSNSWGYFPSAALSWRVSQEKFMKKLPVFSDLKLRASYGAAGNNRIANYAALGIYNAGTYPLNDQLVSASYQENLPNPFLKWETLKSMNFGLDAGFFKQRITLTAEYYDNRSKDLLFNTRIPASSGFVNQFQNIGTTSSRGFELTLNTTNVRSAAFSWMTNLNMAFTNTKVLSLSDGETSMLANGNITSDYILEVGRPVGVMYGYVKEGLYQVNDFDFNPANNLYTLKAGVAKDGITVQPGYIKFKDISGPNGVPDGLINNFDRVALGNAKPTFSGGISNSFSYKGFDLSVFLNFSVGNKVYNANKLNNSNLNVEYVNSFASFADRWTTINASGQRVTNPVELAALNEGKTIQSYDGFGSLRLYDEIVEDGSFLRINNINLGYTLPKKWINTLHIANARVYVTAYNLHVFSKYSGYDPEVSVVNNALTPGIDASAYPRAKSFLAGLNLSF